MYTSIDELKADLDEWIKENNENRPHSEKYCYGKTPLDTSNDLLHIAKDKFVNFLLQTNHINNESVRLNTSYI